MTMLLLVACVLLAAAALLVWRGNRRRSIGVFNEAVAHEEADRYEDACYSYAIAAAAGRNSAMCQEKIRELWRRNGPFQFAAQRDHVVSEFCNYESCGEGFHQLVLSDLRKVLGLDANWPAT
ncbi:MAG: hypothetical protein V1750_03655 [Acidobacteriota bacterium]